MNRRSILAAFPACLIAATGATAQMNPQADDLGRPAPRSYAVLSLVGDTLSVVTYQIQTGSRLDRNLRTSMAVPDEVFDKTVLLATEQALKKLDARTPIQLLAASTPSLFSDQKQLFDGNRLVLPDRLAAGIKGSGATRLLLLTKHRAEAKMQLRQTTIGSGSVEGLGFYVDRDTGTREWETSVGGQGFLGVFAFVKLWLIDLADFSVVGQKAITASHTVTAGRSENSLDPWDALTAEQKFTALRDLLTTEVSATVPALVTTP